MERRDNRGDERGEMIQEMRGKNEEEKIRGSRGDDNERRNIRGEERGEHLELRRGERKRQNRRKGHECRRG